MLDTFVFRLNRLSAYPMLVNMVRTVSGKEFISTKSSKKAVKQELRTWIHDYKNEVAIPIRYSDKRSVPSSNHDIPFSVDWTMDFLEVNVSIPKMLYGNNICELVIPPGHRDFTVNNMSPYHQIDYAFDMMKTTVIKVIHLISNGNYVNLDFNDIEVRRLDVCVNQHFESKDEALRFLKYQRGLKKKHSRDFGKSNAADWKTSITFKTERYYAKIYHKGSEFRDLQQKAIIAINKQRKAEGQSLYSSKLAYAATHLQQLQEYSDRILRYELEFNVRYLNYLFNHKVNKQWSNDWKRCVTLFHFFSRNDFLKMNLFNYELRYVDENGNETVGQPILVANVNFYHKVYNAEDKSYSLELFSRKAKARLVQLKMIGINNQKDFKLWLKYMNRELTRSRKLYMRLTGMVDFTRIESTVDGKKQKNHPFSETPQDCRFTKSLLHEMVCSFHQFFDNFQVVSKNPMQEFQDQLMAWNQSIHVKIVNAVTLEDVTKLKKLLLSDSMRRSLLQFHRLHTKFTMKDLVPAEYSRATYFRVKKLYALVTGKQGYVVHAHFSGGIQRNLHQIYERLYADITFSFLTNFYNKGLESVGIVKVGA